MRAEGMQITLTLTREQMEELARMVAAVLPKLPENRAEAMVEKYGEACTMQEACTILKVSRPTLYRMQQDGRIKTASQGTRIDVRSIAAYMEDRHEQQKR